MSANVHFKEDPQKIAAVASLIQTQRNGFSSALSAINTKATGLRSYWKSDSAEEYSKKQTDLNGRGQELVKILDDFVKKLQQTSGIYTSGEQTAKTAAQSLPTDGVFR
ncbi:MAG: WXG100 family type VII secretion target [Oscillospiraceae bacterium]|jgi:WXG100 family type VII secretion target|nr:WXG100 family type VII secretion target [Oscillospiraceae bacterium]